MERKKIARRDLSTIVYDKLGGEVGKLLIDDAFSVIISSMIDSSLKGENIYVKGFGTFAVKGSKVKFIYDFYKKEKMNGPFIGRNIKFIPDLMFKNILKSYRIDAKQIKDHENKIT